MSDLDLADVLESEIYGAVEEYAHEAYLRAPQKAPRQTRFVRIAQPWEERRAQYLRETGRARQAKRRAAA